MIKSIKAGLVVCVFLIAPIRAQSPATANDPLGALVQVLAKASDSQFQLDVLKGLSAAFKGRRSVPMPAGWDQIETKLEASSNSEVRTLSQSLSVTFGSAR